MSRSAWGGFFISKVAGPAKVAELGMRQSDLARTAQRVIQQSKELCAELERNRAEHREHVLVRKELAKREREASRWARMPLHHRN
jgi:hypothetical protein